MNTDNSLIIFKSICNFVNDLATVFGEKHKPLRLYNRLSSKTQITHDLAIQKHISLFKEFCHENNDSIFKKDPSLLKVKKISYSDRVYIDMGFILSTADPESMEVIWKHLIAITTLIFPSKENKEILKTLCSQTETSQEVVPIGGNEKEFIENLASKIGNVLGSTDEKANPMETISTLLQSGALTDIFSSVQQSLMSGNLDLGKLLGVAQNIAMTDEEKKSGIPPANPLANVDIGSLMKMASSVLGGLNQNQK